MKKIALPLAAALALATAACVPTSQFQKAQKATADNQRKIEERDVTIDQLKTRASELQSQIDKLKSEADNLAQDTALAGIRNRTLSNRLDVLQNDLAALAAKMGDVPEYRSLMSHLSQMQDELVTSNDELLDSRKSLEEKKARLAEANKALAESEEQLQSSNAALADKSREVEYQRQSLEDKNRQIEKQQTELERQQAEIARQAARLVELENQLKAKDQAMAQLKNTIASALVDFNPDELTVVHRDGKVYVSLEEKLLFESGKYDVNNKGVGAIRKIASVLKDVKTDIDIAVEGHTDNVPLRGAVIEDNWDLSAKRATSVLRILVAGGVASDRVQAIGRADTAPVADNATAEGRCKNRRTEIVLTPKIDQILKAL